MGQIAYQDRAEWLALRRQGIGGSDAAAIVGVSPWATAVDVWEDKLGLAEERPPSRYMEWGNRLEEVVADAVAERTGLRLRRVNRILVHPRRPYVLGSVDRLAPGKVVEIKTARSDDGWIAEEDVPHTAPELRVPPHYYTQGQHYLGITGRDEILFGVLVGGSDLRVIPVPADPGFIEDLFDVEADFWTRYVLTGERPPLSWADAHRLPKMYPRGEGERVATPEVDQLVRELLSVRDQEDAITRHRAELEVGIKEYLGEASDLVSSVAKVTWRNSERTAVDWSEVAGGLRSALERFLRDAYADQRAALEAVLSEGFGTTDLAQVEELFTTRTSVRTFRLTRKGTKA